MYVHSICHRPVAKIKVLCNFLYFRVACRLKSLVFGVYSYISLLQDQLGIIARISKCIASRGANILNVDLYIDFDGKRHPVFYARRYDLFVPGFRFFWKKNYQQLWLFLVGSFSLIRNCCWYILQWILMLLSTSSQHEDGGLHPLSVSLPLILCSGRGMKWMRTLRNWKTFLMPTNQSCEFLAAISTWRWLFLHHGRCESWNKIKTETQLHTKKKRKDMYPVDTQEIMLKLRSQGVELDV